MSSNNDSCFEAAVLLARKGGEMIREAFHKAKHVSCKGWSTDLVTETDEAVEKMILGNLKEKFPDHNFIGEESVAAGATCVLDDRPTWMIDPVDGTTNFVHSFPYVAVSIGFLVNRQLVFGVIYNAPQDKMYTARQGQGAFCNGQPMHVTEQTDLKKAIVIMEIGGDRETSRMEVIHHNYQKLSLHPVHSIRALGSAALNMCSIANGECEAYYELGVHCWDYAAGTIILREAGGFVCDPDGSEVDLMSRRVLCGCTESLVRQFSSLLRHDLTQKRDDE